MDLVVRMTVVYVFVFVLTRAIGRRELSTLEPFDVIMLVVIGDLVQQGVTQSDYSITGAMIVLSTLGLLTAGLSYLNFKVPALRPVLDGEPIVLVEDGRLIEANMARERITREDILSRARVQQIATLDAVRWAILETNGEISFIERGS